MGRDLFDFFEGKHDKHDNRQSGEDNRDYQSRKHEDIGQQIMSMFQANKKLLIVAIIVGVALLGIIIFMLISILPMFSSIFENISKNGLKGVVDSAMPIINKLLSGAGK